ncbi:MAG TPA: hypothetical protein VF823_03965, partial [Anaerolineales bacterium]
GAEHPCSQIGFLIVVRMVAPRFLHRHNQPHNLRGNADVANQKSEIVKSEIENLVVILSERPHGRESKDLVVVRFALR